MPKKITDLAFAPRARLIWIALAGFFLGSALCPFNPPAKDGPQSEKQGETMNNPAENLTNIENEHFDTPVPAAARKIQHAGRWAITRKALRSIMTRPLSHIAGCSIFSGRVTIRAATHGRDSTCLPFSTIMRNRKDWPLNQCNSRRQGRTKRYTLR